MTQEKPQDTRKTEIVAAAAALIEEHGEAGFSLREVAKTVGIKLASLQYHFPNKAALMSAILNHIMDAYLAQVEESISSAGENPVEQLKVAARALSGFEDTQDDQTRLEIHLWSMALTDPLVRKTLSDCHKYYISKMAGMIAAANPSVDAQEARKRAVMIASLQEGSMLFMDETVTGIARQTICESLYKTTIDIALDETRCSSFK